MRIAVASDHAGFDLKGEVVEFLHKRGEEVVDFGTNSRESVDFVDFVYPAALAVSQGECERAILLDGAGYPSGIVANMLPNVFAAVANDIFSARLSREHSNANVLCLGGKVVGSGVALEIVATWLEAKFLGGKYAARVAKVEALAKRHKRPWEEQPRKVITVQDVKDALLRKESLVIDASTIITPSVMDLIR
ncbi:MAG: RpiB/LacA/LacB family sugar-phosphate isomerase [Candidatus Sumerlaeaceae bacterium]|nr:RpiB/LacA/LacB family sugar-phosphate isomerase [Candidatus Sumerlaeaceae bacterium]